jgi:hypothetical protein
LSKTSGLCRAWLTRSQFADCFYPSEQFAKRSAICERPHLQVADQQQHVGFAHSPACDVREACPEGQTSLMHEGAADRLFGLVGMRLSPNAVGCANQTLKRGGGRCLKFQDPKRGTGCAVASSNPPAALSGSLSYKRPEKVRETCLEKVPRRWGSLL